MNIVFVHDGGEQVASYRYRCLIPGQELEKHGHTVTYNEGDAHICVFSKPKEVDIQVAQGAKANGCAIVVDIGDDHLGHPQLGPIYDKMLKIADRVVCPTPNMAYRLSEHTEVPVKIIPDPYEMEEMEPHADGASLVWFGHQVNLKDMEPYFNLPNLRIVTGPQTIEGTTFWSMENQRRAMREANIVLLPTRPGVGFKSPNRLVNSLRMGLFPVCDEHLAYRCFRDFVWTNGVVMGLRWAAEFRNDLNDLVREGQNYIRDEYSPERIGEQWAKFIESI